MNPASASAGQIPDREGRPPWSSGERRHSAGRYFTVNYPPLVGSTERLSVATMGCGAEKWVGERGMVSAALIQNTQTETSQTRSDPDPDPNLA